LGEKGHGVGGGVRNKGQAGTLDNQKQRRVRTAKGKISQGQPKGKNLVPASGACGGQQGNRRPTPLNLKLCTAPGSVGGVKLTNI